MRPGDTITGVTKPQNSVFVCGMQQIIQRNQQGVRAEVALVLQYTGRQKFIRLTDSLASARTEPTGAQILNAFSTLEGRLLTTIQTRLDSL